jgi:hypothetical protein
MMFLGVTAAIALSASSDPATTATSWCRPAPGADEAVGSAWKILPDATIRLVRPEHADAALRMLRATSLRPLSPREAADMAEPGERPLLGRIYLIRAGLIASPGADRSLQYDHLRFASKVLDWNPDTRVLNLNVAQMFRGPSETFTLPVIVSLPHRVRRAIAHCFSAE